MVRREPGAPRVRAEVVQAQRVALMQQNAEQSAPDQGRWFWSYHVRIENGSDVAVQLLSRSWSIVDGRGTVHEVVGEGVVGEMPLIAPGASFDYVSGCPLDTASGAMSGSYRMVDENGAAFDVEIPRFDLLSS